MNSEWTSIFDRAAFGALVTWREMVIHCGNGRQLHIAVLPDINLTCAQPLSLLLPDFKFRNVMWRLDLRARNGVIFR